MVLVVLGAIGWILTGIIVVAASGSVAIAGLTVMGILFIVLGLVYLAVARGLLKGAPRTRMVVVMVAALQLLLAVLGWVITADQYQNGRSSGTGSGNLAIFTLIVLFLPKVREFFGRHAV